MRKPELGVTLIVRGRLFPAPKTITLLSSAFRLTVAREYLVKSVRTEPHALANGTRVGVDRAGSTSATSLTWPTGGARIAEATEGAQNGRRRNFALRLPRGATHRRALSRPSAGMSSP
jgi:hypothetical protein